MITHLRASFFTTLLALFLMFVPSFALAATAVFPGSVSSPTKAPTKALPAAPLPDGSMTPPPSVPSGTTGSVDATAQGTTSSSGGGTLLTGGIGILILVGLGWFIIRRRNTAPFA